MRNIFIGSYQQLTATLVLLSILLIFNNKTFIQSLGIYIFIGAYQQLIATLFMQSSGINIFIGAWMFICISLKKKWNPNQKHPSCKKVAAKTWKSCEKMWNQKGAAKACAGMLCITLKVMMTQAAKHFSQATNIEARKMFVAWVIIIKIFNVINSIPAQALAASF